MNIVKKNDFLFKSVSSIQGVGKKLSKYLKNKKIEKINDLLWNLPYSYTDRRDLVNLDKLEIGKIFTIKVKVVKYNFPRIRRLPNKIYCEDEKGKIDLVYFNSREGYIRKILPINKWVVVSGKITFYKNKYQITNPDYVTTSDNIEYVKKLIPKYSLTEGIGEKSYRRIIEKVLKNLPKIKEWHEISFLKKMNFLDWKTSMLKLHEENSKEGINSNIYRRLAYDEIFSHLLTMSENRKRIKKYKKTPKVFKRIISNKILKSLSFELTKSQKRVLSEIEKDMTSKERMFRVVQGDVGSGKTIVSLLAVANALESKFQCALMAPTEILAKQHFELTKKIFKNIKINIALITGKTEQKEKKQILQNLKNNKINFIIGTHSLFQKKIEFNKLGFIIIDEQHKFGVKQRMNLAKKGGDECDVLLMSATPIPRTMMLTFYGDMDISKITEKPARRKNIITLSKPEKKINELWPFIVNQIKNGNQVFWICPLIEESKILNYSSAIKRFNLIEKKFPKKVGLIHGELKKNDKDIILKNFLNKKFDILVSTSVIEVGVDFPNANLIIIEDSNKFGLAQLHQLRGRVGRGDKQATCILLFKENLSKNAIKRIKILKSTDNGFLIAEEDMKLRGYGDIAGFQQSGIKYFRIADPVHHEDLFKLAENEIKKIKDNLDNVNKYNFLIKLFDKAEVFSEL
tara:strand:+ start:331 stop:2388 length:2058 start_codon:yes stop_codon:yes gene_type:complete